MTKHDEHAPRNVTEHEIQQVLGHITPARIRVPRADPRREEPRFDRPAMGWS